MPGTSTPRRRRRGAPLLAFLLLDAVIAAAVIAIVIASGGAEDSVRKAVDGAAQTVLDVSSSAKGAATAAADEPPAPPRGLQRGSLLRRGPLTRALRKADGMSDGRLRLLRLAPERADFQFARRDGGLDLIQVRADGGTTKVRTPAGASAGGSIKLEAIDIGAPGRLVLHGAKRLGRRTGAIDYVVLTDGFGGLGWNAYFKGGRSFAADRHGRITRRIQ